MFWEKTPLLNNNNDCQGNEGDFQPAPFFFLMYFSWSLLLNDNEYEKCFIYKKMEIISVKSGVMWLNSNLQTEVITVASLGLHEEKLTRPASSPMALKAFWLSLYNTAFGVVSLHWRPRCHPYWHHYFKC